MVKTSDLAVILAAWMRHSFPGCFHCPEAGILHSWNDDSTGPVVVILCTRHLPTERLAMTRECNFDDPMMNHLVDLLLRGTNLTQASTHLPMPRFRWTLACCFQGDARALPWFPPSQTPQRSRDLSTIYHISIMEVQQTSQANLLLKWSRLNVFEIYRCLIQKWPGEGPLLPSYDGHLFRHRAPRRHVQHHAQIMIQRHWPGWDPKDIPKHQSPSHGE